MNLKFKTLSCLTLALTLLCPTQNFFADDPKEDGAPPAKKQRLLPQPPAPVHSICRDLTSGTPASYLSSLRKAIVEQRLDLVKFILNTITIDVSDFLNKNYIIHYAIALKYSNTEIIKFLVEKGANVNAKNRYGNTPLNRAASKGNLEIVKFLVEKGAKINATDQNGCTPLHVAASNNCLDIVRFLVENGAKINATDQNGCTPLHVAASKSNLEIVRFLVENGATIDAKNQDDDAPLHIAAACGNLEIVKFLVENGANINAKNRYGETPLRVAKNLGYSGIFEFLVRNGAVKAKNKYSETPLHLTTTWSYLDIVKFLVYDGATIETKNQELLTATCEGYLEAVKFLVENGADIEAKNKYGETPLHIATNNNCLDIVEFLVENGADIEAKNKYGETPLHIAASNNCLDIVEFLIENGAKINATDQYNRTPLHAAAKKGDRLLTLHLLQNGANPDLKNKEGLTPLDIAKSEKRNDIIELLDNRPHQLNPLTGMYPIHQAAIDNDIISLVYWLKCRKIPIDFENPQGYTPLELTIMHNRFPIAKFLINNGANIFHQSSQCPQCTLDILLDQIAKARFDILLKNSYSKLIECACNEQFIKNYTPLQQRILLDTRLSFSQPYQPY